jgi:hypothetical protein
MNKNKMINVLSLIDSCSSQNTGFLPSKTPLLNLPKPYDNIVKACNELPLRYHGENKNCRDWLDETFITVPPNWISKLARLTHAEIESLMTKVSLLCHAYRWGSMPAKKEEYQRISINLPVNLEILWKELSLKLEIPMVGNFYTMVTDNWKHINIKENQEYSSEDIEEGKIEVIHTWLTKPADKELKSFIMAALGMEAQGTQVLRGTKMIYNGILKDKVEDVLKGMELIEDSVEKIIIFFNNSIKKSLISTNGFLKYIQPTMIWLIDDIEGANGTQCCTIQALDSIFGVDRNSTIGKMILRSRVYMLPKHVKLLNSLDESSHILRGYVKKVNNNDLTNSYNKILKRMIVWRISHKNRGANYMKPDNTKAIDNYVSTGLAVELDSNRVDVYKNIMQSHIKETNGKIISLN